MAFNLKKCHYYTVKASVYKWSRTIKEFKTKTVKSAVTPTEIYTMHQRYVQTVTHTFTQFASFLP